MNKLNDDSRIDPRVKAILGGLPTGPAPDVADREALLELFNRPQAVAQRAEADAMMEVFDNTDIAPSDRLDVSTLEFVSSPDGNTVKVQFIRPQIEGPVPCVYYIHGGGMMTMSCFNGVYRAWGRVLANQGVAVAMVDFRNCLVASSAPEVEPFPAGLNDCVSGLRHVIGRADELGIDPDRVVIAGESGGGNLTLATAMQLGRDGDLGLVKGLYAFCPFIAGEWPDERFPSSVENNGIFLDLHNNRAAVAYGIGELDNKNPLAWPSFATEEDVAGFPPTVISVNEADPLRDEGVEFYRLLIRAGVDARCYEAMGTVHGTEVVTLAMPELSYEAAASVARLAIGPGPVNF